MTNEQIFKEFITEQDALAITTQWAGWMLDKLEDLNKRGLLINPDWLRAEGITPHDGEPPMVYARKP